MESCKRGHALTLENLARNGANGFTCRVCKNERARANYWADLEKSREAARKRMRKHLGPLKGHAASRKTHCPQGHPYDDENTYVAPNGDRQCRTCRRVRVMESWWRHRDKRIAENKEWRLANAERVRANLKRWVEENRERSNLLHRLKKQRRRKAGNLSATDWQLVLETYGSKCLACGKDEVTIDHVVPISKGGRNEICNVQPLCRWCNTSKHTKTIDYRPFPLEVLTDD